MSIEARDQFFQQVAEAGKKALGHEYTLPGNRDKVEFLDGKGRKTRWMITCLPDHPNAAGVRLHQELTPWEDPVALIEANNIQNTALGTGPYISLGRLEDSRYSDRKLIERRYSYGSEGLLQRAISEGASLYKDKVGDVTDLRAPLPPEIDLDATISRVLEAFTAGTCPPRSELLVTKKG